MKPWLLLQWLPLMMALLFAANISAAPLDGLTQSIRLQQEQKHQLSRQREIRFLAAHDQQQSLLDSARQHFNELEAINQSLRKEELDNLTELTDLKKTRQIQAGELLLAADVIRQQASFLADKIELSALDSLHPEMGKQLRQLLSTKNLPTADALEYLWLAYLTAISDAGKVIKMNGSYIDRSGENVTGDIFFIGPFATLTQDSYLLWQVAQQKLLAPVRQPSNRIIKQATAFATAEVEVLPMALDPQRKALALLGKTPSALERIHQAGWIGIIILLLGVVGVVIALFRLLVLSWTGYRIRQQLKNLDKPHSGNPLGRVMLSVAEIEDSDDEIIKSRLDEAVLSEVPQLDRGRGLIKLLAAVLPMLGLLGTVTGMIATFQAISHFGTGDPSLMANGISEALMTTLLGLGTAIPLMFLHSLLSARTKGLLQIIFQQSAGILAQYLEDKSGRLK